MMTAENLESTTKNESGKEHPQFHYQKAIGKNILAYFLLVLFTVNVLCITESILCMYMYTALFY